VEVLRRHSKDLGAIERVARLRRHLDRTPTAVSSRSLPQAYQPFKLSQRFDAATVAAIIAAYEDGATAKKLAKHYGVARSSITRLLHRHGVAVRRQSPTDADRQRIVNLHTAGHSMTDVAERLGWSVSTISRVVRAHRERRGPLNA